MSNAAVSVAKTQSVSGRLYYRHTLPVRIMHWTNVVALTILFMSGLMIFNAHPRLYWGKSSYTGRPPILEIGARESPESGAVGYTKVFGREFNTTGVLGLSTEPSGRSCARMSPAKQRGPPTVHVSLGPIKISPHGVGIAVGFLLGARLMLPEASRKGISEDDVYSILIRAAY